MDWLKQPMLCWPWVRSKRPVPWDLRRLVTDDDGSGLKRPMNKVMHRDPKRIREDALASEAMALMRQFRIDELPVVDSQDRPVGLIDVQDLVVLKMLDVSD